MAGLYSLNKEDLLKLDRMGQRLADKILGNVESSKQRALPRLIFALGILHVGSEVAELLSQKYANLDELSQATGEQLTEIPGIGTVIAESVVAYFQVPKNRDVIDKLRGAGVDPQHEVVEMDRSALPLAGKSFVVTGTLSTLPRREAESRIKALGGSVSSSVSGKTTYLVAGESPGSKLDAAQRLGTAVLDEADFLEILIAASAGTLS